MSRPNITVTGVTEGRVERSNVAGIVHGGMGNTLTTTHDQGSRSITNQGNIGNMATGDNHSGAMSASVDGPTSGMTGSRNITNQGNIGNMATGDNHSGAMSASVDGPTSGMTGSRNITNQGNIGNMATGDNHSGAMSASVDGPTSGMTGSRNITNQGNIGNMATGDNHSGAMSASVDGPTSGMTDPQTLTPAELLQLVKEYHCTDDTAEKFEEKRVPGRLFMQLDEALLDELGIDNRIERRKLNALYEDLQVNHVCKTQSVHFSSFEGRCFIL
ncbi:uncharacterized PPE family protein PPE62-like isoform X2 [Haliotis asinina]|uniref:uncharacterized PPE family protein PPE62-like isoform X2 n=1 Tax=Haliotis asinina TaxID=109174 RepID=UPI003531DE21